MTVTSPMDHNVAFGKALRQERRRQKTSQETLALVAGLDRTYISLLELGHRSPTLDTIIALCTALKISFTDLAASTERIAAGHDPDSPHTP